VASLLMLIGGLVWGSVIGTIVGIVATLNPDAIEFRCTMDNLNRFCHDNLLDHSMARRLREYFHQTRHLQIASAQRKLMAQMSPALQAEVSLAISERWLKQVWFLEGVEVQFLARLSLALSAMVFSPGELAPHGFLYIVHRGVALLNGKMVTSGKVWGEDAVLESERLQRKFSARAMSYLEVYMINGETLREAAQAFPETDALLRRRIVRWAVRREFVRCSFLIRQRYHVQATKKFDSALELMSGGSRASETHHEQLHTLLGPESGNCQRLPARTGTAAARRASVALRARRAGTGGCSTAQRQSTAVNGAASELTAALQQWREEREAFSTELRQMREWQGQQTAAVESLASGVRALMAHAGLTDPSSAPQSPTSPSSHTSAPLFLTAFEA